jgi:hypothetical protein
VSSLHTVDDVTIMEALTRQGTRPAVITRANTEARLERDCIATALRELDELVRAISAAHASRKTLSVFIAGSSSLAFLLGNAIAPRVFRDIQVFDYDGAQYSVAYELPYPPIPACNVALWLGASPTGTGPLELEEEIRSIQLEQTGLADRLQIRAISVARPMDLVRELLAHKPGIVQFSGHGNSRGPVFQDDHGEPRPLPATDLAELLRLNGDSVHLVVLAACFSDSYAEDLLAHMDCVIVMRGLVGDTDARMFAKELYRRLAAGDSVQVAFDGALLVMRLERPATGCTRSAADEVPRLRERDPGCADRLFLVRSRR